MAKVSTWALASAAPLGAIVAFTGATQPRDVVASWSQWRDLPILEFIARSLGLTPWGLAGAALLAVSLLGLIMMSFMKPKSKPDAPIDEAVGYICLGRWGATTEDVARQQPWQMIDQKYPFYLRVKNGSVKIWRKSLFGLKQTPVHPGRWVELPLDRLAGDLLVNRAQFEKGWEEDLVGHSAAGAVVAIEDSPEAIVSDNIIVGFDRLAAVRRSPKARVTKNIVLK